MWLWRWAVRTDKIEALETEVRALRADLRALQTDLARMDELAEEMAQSASVPQMRLILLRAQALAAARQKLRQDPPQFRCRH